MTELWLYAIDKYDIDPTTDNGMMRLWYWHSVGRGEPPKVVPTSGYWWEQYGSHATRYMNELKEHTP